MGQVGSTPPAWWSTGTSPVIDPAAVANNHAPANIGQAKWMAKNALDALRRVDVALADRVEMDLVGPGRVISTWDAPFGPEDRARQKSPLMIGQLKAISAPFYSRLNEVYPGWLNHERILNETISEGTIFPWTLTTDDDSNRGIANIGQLKAVFSIRFESLATDDDEDGMADQWEIAYFGNLTTADPNAKLTPDGLTNKEKSDLGLGPMGDDISSAEQRISYSYDGDRLDGVDYHTRREFGYGLDGNGNIETTTSD